MLASNTKTVGEKRITGHSHHTKHLGREGSSKGKETSTQTHPQKWRSPLWARIFFSRSRSSRSLLSRPLARTWIQKRVRDASITPDLRRPAFLHALISIHTWLYFPSFTSFCLFKNQSGILYWRGFCIMVITRSTWQAGHRSDPDGTITRQAQPTGPLPGPHLVLRELSCPLGEIDVCFPQHHMSVSSPYTLRGCGIGLELFFGFLYRPSC